MKKNHSYLFTFILSVCTLFSLQAQNQSNWVYPDPNGKLVYKATPAGDRIMDFSYAGYMGGGVALPDVPVKIKVKPSGKGDDTKVIQDAIDKVSVMQPDGEWSNVDRRNIHGANVFVTIR